MVGGMKTAELIAVLARDNPNGVSFDPMAVRLLRQKVSFEDRQIEDLKASMFQLRNGLWFSREMILDDESRTTAFEWQAMEWVFSHDCFSVERLFNDFFNVLRHISTPEDCAAFLRHLGYTVATWGKGGHFCFLSVLSNLDDSLVAISETIAGRLEESHGTLPCAEIEQLMPHLTAEALEEIRVQFLPEIHKVEMGGVPCWRSIESITLPEDFSEKLTTIVDTMVALEEKLSVGKLEFALNLFYRTRFREEYSLQGSDTFMGVCAQYYQGAKDVFPNTNKFRLKTDDLGEPRKRVRSPNTRFSILGVPVGEELIFIKDRNISCVVLDEINQVRYGGKAWTISALAMHLLGVSSANGFCHFSFQGETLWERRLRLEKADKQAAAISPTTKAK
jgi:hypothetical protein